MGTTQLGQLCWPWPSACCCSSKSAAGLAAARKKRKRRRKVDHTGSASFFSSESSNAPSGLGISASSPDVSATEASFSSKSFNVSLLVASLPIDSLRSMNSLLKNSQDDRNNYRAINASYEIVKHDSHAAVEILQPVRRIRLNNVKKAKKYKRKNDCAGGPPREECQRKQGDHLTGDLSTTTLPGSFRPDTCSTLEPAHIPTNVTARIATMITSGFTRANSKNNPTPTNDPNVPGASGKYPTPHVAIASATKSIRFDRISIRVIRG